MRRLVFLLTTIITLGLKAQSLTFALDVRSTDAQLRGREVLDLALGPDGLWWMATQDEGVLRYDGLSVIQIQWTGQPPIVLGVAPIQKGTYAATSGGLYWIPLEGSAELIESVPGPIVDVEAKGDSLWVLGPDQLWLRIGAGNFQPQSLDGLGGATQFGRRGASWWVASDRGLWIRGGAGLWTQIRDQPVRSAAVDHLGVWAETDQGLERLTDEGWEAHPEGPREAQWIPAKDYGAWWAVGRDGLYWIDGKVRSMVALSGNPLDGALALASDGNGGLLLALREGIIRIPRPEHWYDLRSASYTTGRIKSVARRGSDQFAVLGSKGLQLLSVEGQVAIPLPKTGVPSGLVELPEGRWLIYGEFGALEWVSGAWKSRLSEWVLEAGTVDDSVYVQTTEGYQKWSKGRFEPCAAPAKVLAALRSWPELGYFWHWGDLGLYVNSSQRGLSPFGSPRWVLRSWQIQEGQGAANFVLRLARLGDPQADARTLRYRRDGADWVDLGAGRTLVLAGLSPGRHLLELDSDPIQRFSLWLPAPWWAQPRFWVPLALALFAAAGTLFWLALRRRRESKKWAAEKAELERMALRLQMNPHFTFNALESISSFVMEQKPREAVLYLNRFAKLMRYTLEKADQERVELSDELDALSHYVVLEQMRFDQSFDHVLEVDEALDPADLAIPPMLLQPLVENAILHGLRPLHGRRGRLTLRLLNAVEPGRIRIEIEDNGIGRVAAAAQQTGDEGQKRSMATRILESRLKALAEASGEPFSLAVEDLNEGTRVVLALPKVEVWGV